MSAERWRILDVDLSAPLPDLGADPEIAGLFVVFWLEGVPLGHREVSADELPLSPFQLAEIAAEAMVPSVVEGLFGRELVQPPEGEGAVRLRELLACDTPLRNLAEMMRAQWARLDLEAPRTVSVVVCTRDRAASLERCLRSMQGLSPAPAEILVVDNAPSSNATERALEKFSGVRYLREPRPGLDIARNTGARESRGEIVAFADDDVTVHPEWIRRLRHGFRRAEVMAVTGLVLPAELETEAQYLFEHYWGFNRGYRPREFGPSFFRRIPGRRPLVELIGAGANMAFRRSVFERVGGFDERLDAGAAGCAGDTELWYRLMAEGWTCRYEPGAVVFHHHRREMAELDRQIFSYLRGHTAGLLVEFERYREWANLRRLLVTLPLYFCRLTARRWLCSDLRSRTVRCELAGALSGVLYYLRHRRPAALPPPMSRTVYDDL